MDDSGSIDGVWEIVKAELAGEPMPADLAARIEIVLADGRYEVRFDREVSDEGTYVLALAGATRTIELTGRKGPNAGRTIPSIYQVAGNRLRVCYGLDGTRPPLFTTVPGTRHYLATYRRKPAPNAEPVAQKATKSAKRKQD